VPRRNLIPFALLAVLVVLTLLFAVIGQRSSPDRASLAVQNATDATFGNPAGSTSFSMNVVNSLSASIRSRFSSQERLVVYRPPGRMTVYRRSGARPPVRIAVLGANAIPCVLSAYTSIVGGSTAWTATAQSDQYARVESLADYSARVPHASGSICAPQPSAVRGTVEEQAALMSGYLVGLTVIVTVPAQRLPDGRPAPHGIEAEELELLTIDGTSMVARL
jgi:hypothetical protein